MNKKSTTKGSQTDWTRVTSMKNEDIDFTDIPEITEEQMKDAKLRIGGKPVPKGKVRINILLDSNVVAYFKTHAGGRGYQTLIYEALKNTILYQDLEKIIRRIIREELQNVSSC